MPSFIGRIRSMGIAREATKGTAVVPEFWLPVDKFDPNPIVMTKVKDGAIGRIEDSYDSEIVTKHSEPSIEGYVTDTGVGLMMLATFGDVAVTTPEAGVYSHAFSVKNDADHPSLSVSFKDPNMGKTLPYAMVNGFQLDAKTEDYLRFATDLVSRFEADQSGLTPSFYETDNVFVARHVSVKIANDLAGLGAATAKTLTAASIKITKNVEAVFGLGSNEPQAIYNKEFAIEGSLEAIVADETWRDLFIANTTKAMRISIINSDVTIGLANNPTIIIDIARVKFNPYKEGNANADLVSEQVSFKGMYSIDDTESITATVINTIADYE